MDKKFIIQEMLNKLRLKLSQVSEAAEISKSLTTEGDLKSDGKYDTRGIEAGYLAGAQAKRVEEIKRDIHLLENLNLTDSTKVRLGSIITLGGESSEFMVFLVPCLGGEKIELEGVIIKTITVHSPLGENLIGLELEDEFEFINSSGVKTYQIIALK